jgi:hypothetical protein
LFRTKGEVILIYLSKRKEKLRFGGKESSQAQHRRVLVITAIQVDPARGSTGILEARGNLHFQAMGTMKKV